MNLLVKCKISRILFASNEIDLNHEISIAKILKYLANSYTAIDRRNSSIENDYFITEYLKTSFSLQKTKSFYIVFT